MIKKFLSGVVFGAGFTVAVLAIYTVWMFFVLPPMIVKGFDAELHSGRVLTEGGGVPHESVHTPDFHKLSVDEKIDLSTAIIIVRYEKDENGAYRSIVEDILKKKDEVELYYNVGDVYEESSHYTVSDGFVPNRAIVFMQGNPAGMRFSTTFEGERIQGLGGIPLALLREKCSGT